MTKPWLYFFAGVMWAGVGILLNRYVVQWVAELDSVKRIVVIVMGLILAFTMYFFGFSKFADKNIKRISGIQSDKPCVFAFQQWSSYPLVMVMISLGIYLRIYSPFPKTILAVMYLGIGGNFFMASFHYFRAIIKKT